MHEINRKLIIEWEFIDSEVDHIFSYRQWMIIRPISLITKVEIYD